MARAAYTGALDAPLSTAAPAASARARDGFAATGRALDGGDAPAFATAHSQIWTALLDGGYRMVERALQAGDAATAQAWLPPREFRRATRFTRANADATLAIDGVAAGRVTAADALLAARADLLDTYQARRLPDCAVLGRLPGDAGDHPLGRHERRGPAEAARLQAQRAFQRSAVARDERDPGSGSGPDTS